MYHSSKPKQPMHRLLHKWNIFCISFDITRKQGYEMHYESLGNSVRNAKKALPALVDFTIGAS